jgi:hypothetical protein
VVTPDAEAAVFTVNVDGSGLKPLTSWTLRVRAGQAV